LLYTIIFTHSEFQYKYRLGQFGLLTNAPGKTEKCRSGLIEVYKMLKGVPTTPCSLFCRKAEETSTSVHSWKLMNIVTHGCVYFFHQRVINR